MADEARESPSKRILRDEQRSITGDQKLSAAIKRRFLTNNPVAINQNTEQRQQPGKSGGDTGGKEGFQISAPWRLVPETGGVMR
jgi:hypothetical protein